MIVITALLLALVCLGTHLIVRTKREIMRCEVCKELVPLHDIVYLPEPPSGLILCLDCESGRK